LCGLTTAVTSFTETSWLVGSGRILSSARLPRGRAGPTWTAGCRILPSDGRRVAVAGAYPHHGLDPAHPDPAVADPSGLRGLGDDVDDVGGVTVVDDDLDADLRHQGDVVLRAPVDLGVALLPPVAADLADRHAGHPEGLEGLADVLPLVRL